MLSNLQQNINHLPQEFKRKLLTFSECHNKYDNKFSYRKRETNKWLAWAYVNKQKNNSTGLMYTGKKYDSLLQDIDECLKYKWDGYTELSNGMRKIRFLGGWYCRRYKLCSNCARIKANRDIKQFRKYLGNHPELVKKNRYYLVLTVKNGFDFNEVYNHLEISIQKIRQAIKDAKRNQTKTIFSYIEGAILALEFTYNTNTGWHPHMNFLFCTDHLFDLTKKGKTTINKDITKEWYEKTGDSYITSLQKVFVKPYGTQDSQEFDSDLKDKTYEVLKYVTKFSDLSHELRRELFTKTKNFRFLRKWGCLYGAPIEESDFETENFMKGEHELILMKVWNITHQKYEIDFSPSSLRPNIELSIKEGRYSQLQSFVNGISPMKIAWPDADTL